MIISPKITYTKKSNLNNNSWELISIIINEEFLENLIKEYYQEKEIYFSFDYLLINGKLSLLLKNLILDSLKNEKLDENKFSEFFNYLFFNHSKINEHINSSVLAKNRFNCLFDELKNGNYDLKELNFYKMAEIMNMNPYYFHRKFSKIMGITPSNYKKF